MRLIPQVNPLDDWDNMPLSHARIGYENLLISSDTTGAGVMLNPNTFQRYTPPGGSVTTRFQFSASTEIDFVGIASHNAGSHDSGTEILLQYATTIGGALTPLASITPESFNPAVMFSFDPITVAEIAITTNAVSGLELGVIYAGKALQMYQPIYGGLSPVPLSGESKFQSPRSDTGQFLGLTWTKEGLVGSFPWKKLDPIWYRERFQPFVNSIRTKPFFINWRPDRFNEVAYCSSTDDVLPTNDGAGTDLMSVTINVRGHSDIRS